MPETEIFRIHGDNILECENALRILAKALKCVDKPEFCKSLPFAPLYQIKRPNGVVLKFQLLPGYGRWGIDLQRFFLMQGAPLREATDAVITRVTEAAEGLIETPFLAFEFCGALPAGNNAWQRCGRALSMAYAKIPYLYYAEIGGVELGEDRTVKAPRFPNPLVPFAYVTLGSTEKTIATPVFVPSPTITPELRTYFTDCFGSEDALLLIQKIFDNEDTSAERDVLTVKAERTVAALVGRRRPAGILSAEEWLELAAQSSGQQKAVWLIERKLPWKKKTGIPTITTTFKQLSKIVALVKMTAAGSSDMPLCLLDAKNRGTFSGKLEKLYRGRVSTEFLNWVADSTRPLVCVWVAGFKPRGDDSRPDRGLLPLARMIFGRQDIDVLTVIYGPAKPSTWQTMQRDIFELSRTNGLWESVLKLSDAILVDTKTNRHMGNIGLLLRHEVPSEGKVTLQAASLTPNFGEHDVDSVLHLLFSEALHLGVHEGLCNPPGGDWSGISILDFNIGREFRWSSLPRVSGETSKRPDHLVQLQAHNSLIVIESKDHYSTLECGVGERLKKYVSDLLDQPPFVYRVGREEEWIWRSEGVKFHPQIISAAAIRYTGENCMMEAYRHGAVDVVFGVEFSPETDFVTIHILASTKGEICLADIQKIAQRFESSLRLVVSRV